MNETIKLAKVSETVFKERVAICLKDESKKIIEAEIADHNSQDDEILEFCKAVWEGKVDMANFTKNLLTHVIFQVEKPYNSSDELIRLAVIATIPISSFTLE